MIMKRQKTGEECFLNYNQSSFWKHPTIELNEQYKQARNNFREQGEAFDLETTIEKFESKIKKIKDAVLELADKETNLRLYLGDNLEYATKVAERMIGMGIAAKKDDETILYMGLTGILHDIGSWQFVESFEKKRTEFFVSRMSDYKLEEEIYKKYIQESKRILNSKVPKNVMNAIEDQFEFKDGSGLYGRKTLAGSYSQLLSLASVYQSMVDLGLEGKMAIEIISKMEDKFDKKNIELLKITNKAREVRTNVAKKVEYTYC